MNRRFKDHRREHHGKSHCSSQTSRRPLCNHYAVGPFFVSILYVALLQIVDAVHTPDRVTLGVEMFTFLEYRQSSRNLSRKATNLQFIVGQDEQGHWVAVEAHGRGGGIFVSRQAALKYAASETGQRLDTVRCSNEPLTCWGEPDADASVT